MDEFFQKVTSQQDPFKKLVSYIPGFGGVRSKFQIVDSELLNHRVEVIEGVLAVECVRLLQDFFAARR